MQPSKHKSPRIIVLILNWNGWADTIECVQSVQKSCYPNFGILVVDNHSDNDSVQMLKQHLPDIEILQTEQNLGYTGGNNAGFDHLASADIDYIFVLNNDTVIDVDCLAALVDAGETHANSGIIGAFVFSYPPPGEFAYAGLKIPVGREVPEMAPFHKDDVAHALRTGEVVSVDAAHGCAFAIKKEVLMRVGGFDPAFFAIHDEVDFSVRVRETGFDVVSTPAARVYHKAGASFGNQSVNRIYYDVRNRALYFVNRAQSANTKLSAQFWRRYIIHGVGRVTKLIARRDSAAAKAVFWGTLDGIRGKGGKRQAHH